MALAKTKRRKQTMNDQLKLYWILDKMGCKPLLRGNYVVLPKVKYRFNTENEMIAVEER